jgi:hypothetical protein
MKRNLRLVLLGACLSLASSADAQMRTWYKDADGDGFGSMTSFQSSATVVADHVLNNLDCNDHDGNNAQWNVTGAPAISAGIASFTSVAVNPMTGMPYVAYQDFTNGGKVTVMRFDGTGWVTVGTSGFSAGSAGYVSMAFDASGTPYVVYEDAANSYRTTVMRFNGTSWASVGTAGFSTAWGANYTDIVVSPTGTPYIVFEDYGASTSATVKRYNGTTWVDVGAAGFTGGQAEYTTIAMSANGTPYVAFRDGANGYKATVMRFDGSSWVHVGTPGMSVGEARFTEIAVTPSGTPYIVYKDMGMEGKAVVKKFNGTSWVDVGSGSVSAGGAFYTGIIVDATEKPYVVYEDSTLGNRLTVMRYDGTSWATVGSAGISGGISDYVSIAADTNGVPHIVYQNSLIGGNATVMTVMPEMLGAPTTPTLSATQPTICIGKTGQLSVSGGSLNDASEWYWYTSSCGGTAAGMGNSLEVTPGTTTTYYVRAEGDCISSPGTCDMITLTVDPLPTVDVAAFTSDSISLRAGSVALPAGTPSGGVYTGAGVSGTMFDPAAAGAGTHWITYTYTNANGCINSDSTSIRVFIPAGIGNTSAAVFNVYPNPARDMVAISLNSVYNDIELLISDMSGKVIRKDVYNNAKDLQLNVANLNAGIYILTVKADDTKANIRFTKE